MMYVSRLQLVLFGDSLTQRSFHVGGWGGRLAAAHEVRRSLYTWPSEGRCLGVSCPHAHPHHPTRGGTICREAVGFGGRCGWALTVVRGMGAPAHGGCDTARLLGLQLQVGCAPPPLRLHRQCPCARHHPAGLQRRCHAGSGHKCAPPHNQALHTTHSRLCGKLRGSGLGLGLGLGNDGAGAWGQT
jgi:hypothetical protein